MTRSAIIVAHGQPSDPGPAEDDMAHLALAVGALMPAWQVRSATLASEYALKNALERSENPVIFPFFMADGWFVKSALPKRLREAGSDSEPTILPPFGLLPGTLSLAARFAATAAGTAGWEPGDTTLLLAAHGSGRSRKPAKAAETARAAIASMTGFTDIRLGFIEEAPHLAEAAKDLGSRSICLPLFVARWGHVIDDIPDALDGAGFRGLRLDPLGTHPNVPALIAETLGAA